MKQYELADTIPVMKVVTLLVPNITGTIERTPFMSETIEQTLKQYELVDTIPVMKVVTLLVPNITGTIERTPFMSETIEQILKQYELADTRPVMKVVTLTYWLELTIMRTSYRHCIDYYADIVSTSY